MLEIYSERKSEEMLKVIKGILGLVIIAGVMLLAWNWWTGRGGEEKPLGEMVGNFTDTEEWTDKLFAGNIFAGDKGNQDDGNKDSAELLKNLLGEVDVKELLGAVKSGGADMYEIIKEQLGDISLDKLAEAGVYDTDEQSCFDDKAPIYTEKIEYTDLGADISSLKLNIGGCVLKMEPSADGQFHLQAEGYGKMQYGIEGEVFNLVSVKSGGSLDDIANGVICIYIPEDTKLHTAEVQLGAGVITGDILRADNMQIKVDMGNFELQELQAATLELQLSMGQIKTLAEVSRQLNVYNSMGNMELMLAGKQEQYNYEISGAMSQIVLGDRTYEGMADSDKIDNNASVSVDVETSMGNTRISFAE